MKIPDEKLKKKLTKEQYNICFLKGTEPPFSGKYTNNKEPGMYHCVACGQELFSSDTKYDSGTGWPSFWDSAKQNAIKIEDDYSLGMHRTEVLCSNCGAHLGHVFDDLPAIAALRRSQAGGPKDKTGKRYCINSLALEFKPKEKQQGE